MKTLLDIMSNNFDVTFNGTQNGFDIYETKPNEFIIVCPKCNVIVEDTTCPCPNCGEYNG